MLLLTAQLIVFLLSSCAIQQQHFITIDSKKHPVDIEAIDASIFIMNSAWKSHEERYKKKENYKAFAQSKSGAWGWQGNVTSEKHATQLAMDTCRKHNKKYEANQPCMIVKLGDKWGAELDLDR